MRNGTQTNVRLDDDLIEWFKVEAANQDRSFSWLVNHALKNYQKRIDRDRKRRGNDDGK